MTNKELGKKISSLTSIGQRIDLTEFDCGTLHFVDGEYELFIDSDQIRETLAREICRSEWRQKRRESKEGIKREKYKPERSLVENTVKRGFNYGILKANMRRKTITCKGHAGTLMRVSDPDYRARVPEIVEFYLNNPEKWKLLKKELSSGDKRAPFRRKSRKVE